MHPYSRAHIRIFIIISFSPICDERVKVNFYYLFSITRILFIYLPVERNTDRLLDSMLANSMCLSVCVCVYRDRRKNGARDRKESEWNIK